MANARILIVEDESIVAKDIQNSLTGLGYTVAGVVAFGEEAVERAGALKPDLILMDVQMRGMNGIDATRNIHARWPQVRIILISAYGSESQAYCREVGASGFLPKAELPNHLSEMVADLFGLGEEPGRAAAVVAHRRLDNPPSPGGDESRS